jgi:hypothetical protein
VWERPWTAELGVGFGFAAGAVAGGFVGPWLPVGAPKLTTERIEAARAAAA